MLKLTEFHDHKLMLSKRGAVDGGEYFTIALDRVQSALHYPGKAVCTCCRGQTTHYTVLTAIKGQDRCSFTLGCCSELTTLLLCELLLNGVLMN